MNYLLELKTNHLGKPRAVLHNVLRDACRRRELIWKPSTGLLRCIYPSLCRLCAYNNLLMLWVWHVVDGDMPSFLLVGHTWQGISLVHCSDKSSYCHGKMTPTEGVKIGMKTFCSLPWVWCYDPQLETCHTWVAESVPTCQILSWCRGGRICPSHLWGNTKRI